MTTHSGETMMSDLVERLLAQADTTFRQTETGSILIEAADTIARLEGDRCPPGYKLVPVEPTDKMVEAGGQYLNPMYSLTDCYRLFRIAWRDALAASPSSPDTQGDVVGRASHADEVKRLRGTLEYILAQANQGYPTVLSVIKANAKAALDDEWQETYRRARALNDKGE